MMVGPGSQLGNYTILRSLGSGGMADVYEAEDQRLGRRVALKILPVEFCRNPELVARFEKEVRAAASLNHRNIVTVFEVGHQDQIHYYSMRLLTGGDLRKRIERGLSPVEALAILREVADAFVHAHTRGFVHRDVKPENIMFDEQGFPVLTDFGIAKALAGDSRMTRTGMTMGTPRYLSPEQASGKPVDARADLYSLGVILYEMLTGRPPYEAEESMAVIFKHVTEPVPQLPGELTGLQPLLEKLMAKDANHRIGSAAELIRAIDAMAPRPAPRDRPPSQVTTAENPLIANLLTPSPLRTAPPLTPRPEPRPATPAPAPEPTGELAIKPPVVRTRRDSPAAQQASQAREQAQSEIRQRIEAAPPFPAPGPEVAAPVPPAAARSKAPVAVLGSAAVAVAALGFAAWAYRQDIVALFQPAPAVVEQPAQAPAPATAKPAVQDEAARQRVEQETRRRQEAARLEKLRREEEARKAAEADAARKAQEQARQEQLRREQEAARTRAAEAEAKKRAETEAAAKRRQEQEAAEQREQARLEKLRQEEEARKAAEVDAARKKQAQAKSEKQLTAEEKKAQEEAKAKERARRPTGF